MRIVVAGALAGKPGYGGEAWVRLAWVEGLRRLGADVLFVEEVADEDLDPAFQRAGRRFFRRTVRDRGLAERSGLISSTGRGLAGVPPEAVADFASGADLLVNVSGNLTWEPAYDGPRRRAYVDLDPGFTQFWHAGGVADLRLDKHDVHFTVGENVGRTECSIPTAGLRWHPVRQPVVIDDWAVLPLPSEPRFTTVASWRGAFGPVEYGGHRYGLKVHEFRKLADLPTRVPAPMEIAVDMDPADDADRRRMEDGGWILRDPRERAGTPEAFRAYVRASTAELSAAQGIYVETASGWFSDRSARYLASGRPVVVQDTGLGARLPLGVGVLAFRTLDDAAEAARAVLRDPERHGLAARAVAEEHFASDRVLTGFLERALDSGARTSVPVSGEPDPGRTERFPAPRKSPGSTKALRVVVSGMVGGVPDQGGASWVALQWALGVDRLGHDLLFVEDLDEADLVPRGVPLDRTRNAELFLDTAERYGLRGRCALRVEGRDDTVGLPADEVRTRIADADVLVNLSGALTDPAALEQIPVRVYVDLDPTFTQLWHAVEGLDMGLGAHTHFATVGLRIGSEACPIPTCGRSWLPVLPPVVLDLWEPTVGLERDAVTTVANWRGYGAQEWRGERYGTKAHSFRSFFPLPRRTGERFDVALAIHPDEVDDLAAFREHGWHLADPVRVAGTPPRYRRFVRGSAIELGVAKEGYVRSGCGWVSDRSACYLAAGRPVLAQDTGLEGELPTGRGILLFRTLEEAADGVRAIRRDYEIHRKAAREVAEELFDARRVIAGLLDRAVA